MNDDSELKMIEGLTHSRGGGADRNTLTLEIPVKKPDVDVPVVELFLKS